MDCHQQLIVFLVQALVSSVQPFVVDAEESATTSTPCIVTSHGQVTAAGGDILLLLCCDSLGISPVVSSEAQRRRSIIKLTAVTNRMDLVTPSHTLTRTALSAQAIAPSLVFRPSCLHTHMTNLVHYLSTIVVCHTPIRVVVTSGVASFATGRVVGSWRLPSRHLQTL